MILKVFCKILVSFRLVQNLKISDLAMAKDKMSISQLPKLYFIKLVPMSIDNEAIYWVKCAF